MHKVVHLSDLHFGREEKTIQRALLVLLEQLAPELVVISGDLTQRAKQSEYLSAKHFLHQVGIPFLVIPGNHDIPLFRPVERLLSPWQQWFRYVGRPVEPVYKSPSLVVVGLDSVRRFGWYLDWSRGRVNRQQGLRVQSLLQQASADCLRMVAVHHPLWLPPAFARRQRLLGHETLLTLMKEKEVDIILSGHVHAAYATVQQGILLVHAGSAISRRVQADYPNSFNLLMGNRHQMTLQVWEWGPAGFSPVREESFTREHSGWQRRNSAVHNSAS